MFEILLKDAYSNSFYKKELLFGDLPRLPLQRRAATPFNFVYSN
jgi:hypothetical protein